ncbi:MAG TPA: hypothetical protein PKE69_23820, partial [Pyrinomonadaceae bacterium]|nr:hypothetical protein [Pyrinomonadaceae bacterium]
FNEISGNLSTATKYFSESAGLIKEEVAEIKQLVGMTAVEAKDKVALVSRTIDRTQLQVVTTTDYIQTKVVEPAREIAAIMAGVGKGLEVLFAPAPKPIDRAYTDRELFMAQPSAKRNGCFTLIFLNFNQARNRIASLTVGTQNEKKA